MGEENRVITRSYRVTQEDADRFVVMAKKYSSQQATFKEMLDVFEMQHGKMSMPEYQESINRFEDYTKALLTSYISALDDKKNARDLIQNEFKEMLQSKDSLILELQKKANSAECKAEEAVSRLKETETRSKQRENEFINKIADLQKEHAKKCELDKQEIKRYEQILKDRDKMIFDKEALLNTTKSQYQEAMRKIASMEEAVIQKDSMILQIAEQKKTIDTLKSKIEKLEEIISISEQEYCQKLDAQKLSATLEKEKELLDMERTIRAEAAKQVALIQQQYTDMLNKTIANLSNTKL